jgi:hypothetical protein
MAFLRCGSSCSLDTHTKYLSDASAAMVVSKYIQVAGVHGYAIVHVSLPANFRICRLLLSMADDVAGYAGRGPCPNLRHDIDRYR